MPVGFYLSVTISMCGWTSWQPERAHRWESRPPPKHTPPSFPLSFTLTASAENPCLAYSPIPPLTPSWPAAGSVDTNLSFLSLLELYRTEVAEGRVASARIVEALDVIEHISTCLIAGPIHLARSPLGLQ